MGEAVVKDGYIIRKASAHFGVSVGFASEWFQVFRARDSVGTNDVKRHNDGLTCADL